LNKINTSWASNKVVEIIKSAKVHISLHSMQAKYTRI
jgi:hypothetical protein